MFLHTIVPSFVVLLWKGLLWGLGPVYYCSRPAESIYHSAVTSQRDKTLLVEKCNCELERD